MTIPYDTLSDYKNVDKYMNINVLWVDTEQGECHVRRVIERISTMTGAKMGGAVERTTLRNKIIEALGLNADSAKMRIRRLIEKGHLITDRDLICTPGNKGTKEQKNRGAPDVPNVPFVPFVPDVPDVLDVLDVPCVLDVLDVPRVPDVPCVP